MRPPRKPHYNQVIPCADGTTLYRMSRKRGNTGRVGVTIRSKPDETRDHLAWRLKQARKTITGIRRALP